VALAVKTPAVSQMTEEAATQCNSRAVDWLCDQRLCMLAGVKAVVLMPTAYRPPPTSVRPARVHYVLCALAAWVAWCSFEQSQRFPVGVVGVPIAAGLTWTLIVGVARNKRLRNEGQSRRATLWPCILGIVLCAVAVPASMINGSWC
jgi:peptidoglycan/LPS O-acetylase OafA/YrhL